MWAMQVRPAFVLAFLAACPSPGQAPPAAVSASTLGELPFPDGRCRVAGGLGVTLGGRCVALTIRSDGWASEGKPTATDPRAAQELARAAGAACHPGSNVVVGGGASFLYVRCFGDAPGERDALIRVDAAGAVTRAPVPWESDALLTFVAGTRPVLFARFNFEGTVAFDPATLAARAGWKRVGAWGNAHDEGAAVSADGHYLAIPAAYDLSVYFVRIDDLRPEASLRLTDQDAPLRDEGPGKITWSASGLEVTTYGLPYE